MAKDFLSSVTEGISGAVTGLNPLARNIDKKDKRIIEALYANGFKSKDIIRFVDVYKSDVESYAEVCKESAKMVKAMVAAQTTPKSE